MKQSSNYQLNQWEKTDRIQMEDFNGDNAKVDAALKAQKDDMVALSAAMALCGNCKMSLTTYTGTGTSGSGNTTVIDFGTVPDVFFIVGDQAMVTGRGGVASPLLISDDATYSGCFVGMATASWNGSKLSLTNSVNARYQMNSSGKVYWVLALNTTK